MELNLKRGALFFLVLTFLLLATGCEYEKKDPQTGVKFEEKPLFTLDDGCKVSSLRSPETATIYRIKCQNVPPSSSAAFSCGKSCQATVSYEVKLTPEQEAEIAKNKALAKLSTADKQALGLMPEIPKEPK